MKSLLVYLIAGEASGDALGADLMHSLKELHPDLVFAGIGGEAMQVEGLNSLFNYSELSVMGFAEIVPHIPKMLLRLRETALDIAARQPSVVITIDSPGFTFRLAKALKKNPRTNHIPRIHYVAPSVWAYKPKRAHETALLFDRLLTLLPFEPPYFEKEGLHAVFVGHPVLWSRQHGDSAAFRMRHAIEEKAPLLLLLPGSRRGEIEHHLGLFMEAANSQPDFTPVILAGSQVKDLIAAQVPTGFIIADISEKTDAFAAASLALTKSGTISLELAVAGVPMVVAHHANPLSAWLIKRMIRIAYVSLINIAANHAIIPELLQERCNVTEISSAIALLAAPAAQEMQRRQCTEAITLLKGGNIEPPGIIAAREVLSVLSGNKN